MPKAELWIETQLCTIAVGQRCGCAKAADSRNARGDPLTMLTGRIIYPTKGTTPARGEEARVVVYQPRGVGLIHPRLKAE